MAAVAHLASHPELPRPTLRIGFTPDEEIGEGALTFDIERFGALCAYTLDGSELGELQDETFSALEAHVVVHGVEVHPGMGTGKLVNALRLAAKIVAALPSDTLTPETTAGREGFIHPYAIQGTPSRAEFCGDPPRLRRGQARAARGAVATDRARRCRRGAARAARDRRFGRSTRTCAGTSTPCRRWSTPPARRSRPRGSSPLRTPIRGGTDGSILSARGLPTPNIFTGGHEYHSVREWASRPGDGRGRRDGRAARGGLEPPRVRALGGRVGSSPDGTRSGFARVARRRDHARRRGDDPRHRRGTHSRRRRIRGDPCVRRKALRVRGAHGAARTVGSQHPAQRRSRGRARGCPPAARRGRARAGGAADHADARRTADHVHRAAAPAARASAARDRHLLPHARARRRQVAVLRGEHARRAARPRAGVRRGAAGDASRPGARGADELDLLGQRRRASDTAALRSHPRVDHAGAGDRRVRRDRASVHARGPVRRRRGVPRLDRPRGPADRRGRRSRVPGLLAGFGADRGGGRTSESQRSWQAEGPDGHRQPAAVHQGRGGLAVAARPARRGDGPHRAALR